MINMLPGGSPPGNLIARPREYVFREMPDIPPVKSKSETGLVLRSTNSSILECTEQPQLRHSGSAVDPESRDS
jgi:hypothetical protein